MEVDTYLQGARVNGGRGPTLPCSAWTLTGEGRDVWSRGQAIAVLGGGCTLGGLFGGPQQCALEGSARWERVERRRQAVKRVSFPKPAISARQDRLSEVT